MKESPQTWIADVVRAYDDPVARAYVEVRFRIVHQRFLEEIRQYLPRRARILELGCGLGLFALYFARSNPDLRIEAFDLSSRRVRMATHAAERLGLENVTFRVGDACDGLPESAFDAVYVLDLLHHLPPARVPSLLRAVADVLTPDGVFVVKDVDTRPRYRAAFTWLMDVLVTRGERPHYWPADLMTALLDNAGFRTFTHSMADELPYSHRLFIAHKARLGDLSGAWSGRPWDHDR